MWIKAVFHDDVIKWKHFPRYWPFMRGIHRSPVNFPHKGKWRGDLIFSLIYVWINGWVNNREAGDLRQLSCPLWRHCNVLECSDGATYSGVRFTDNQSHDPVALALSTHASLNCVIIVKFESTSSLFSFKKMSFEMRSPKYHHFLQPTVF